MNIDFSLVQASDKKQLLQLLSDRQDEANQLRGESGNIVKEEGAEYFDKVIQSESIELIVGRVGDEIIATTTIFYLPRIRKTSYFVILEDILVRKDHRGKGVGSAMMKYVIDYCKENPDVRKIKFGSLLESTKAHGFYEKLGFEFKEKMFQMKLR